MVPLRSESFFFDTNVFIRILREPGALSTLEPLFECAQYLYVVNKIVLMELWAGSKTQEEFKILRALQTSHQLIGLDDHRFIEAGTILSRLHSSQEGSARRRRGLTWDILLALSARDHRAFLVTENLDDFKRIRNVIDFEYCSLDQIAQVTGSMSR